MIIILIGYMGSGKTSIGRLLSLILRNKFYDLDEIIINWKNQYIYNILLKNGEKNFRKNETLFLHFFKNVKIKIILSTGGGTPCFRGNIHYLNWLGRTYYLHLSSKEIFQRIRYQTHKRPLISYLSSDKLLTFVHQHLSNRIKYYDKSNYKIKIGNSFPEEIVFYIHNQLSLYYYRYGNIKIFK